MGKVFEGHEAHNKGKNLYNHIVLPKLGLIESWARLGLSNVKIAAQLDIPYSTFNVYRSLHKALALALDRGRQDTELIAENALFKRVRGYKYKEITEEFKNGIKSVKTTTKRVLPDVQACIYWLEHRAPKRWTREKWRQELEERKIKLMEEKIKALSEQYNNNTEDDEFIQALTGAVREVWEEYDEDED